MTIETNVAVFPVLTVEQIETATARLARLSKLHNVEFLRYEDYRPLDDSRDYPRAWGYATRADGDVSYGDMKTADCPNNAENYLRALSTALDDSNELYFYVPYASGSDYAGSTVERSNYNSFIESYGENEWVFSAHGGYDTYAACVSLTGLLTCDDDTADTVLDTLEGLEDYPCIDEDALSKLESENSDEAWNCWVAGDFRKAVESKFNDCAEFEWPDDNTLRSFFEERAEKSNEYWFNEGSGHDMYIRVAEIVSDIEFDDVSDYAVHYKLTFCGDCGTETEEFYCENDCIERIDELQSKGFFGHYEVITPAGAAE
jgi:hypothetical protein